MSWTAWDPAPGVLAGAGIALVLFARGFVRLRRRGRADLAGLDRALLFALGVAAATLALVSPLDAAGDGLLSAHMLQHVLVGDVAPALVVVSLRGPLAFFLLPSGALRVLARRQALRCLLGRLLRPRVSLGVWALGIGLWHVPAAYDSVLVHPLAHDLEHLTFMLGGVLVWTQLIDPTRRGALARSGRLACAACVFAAGAALAGVLLLAAPLYPSYAGAPAGDQRLAGLVMLVEQGLSLGACTAFLLLRRPARSPGIAGARLAAWLSARRSGSPATT